MYIVIEKGTADSWNDAAIVTDENGKNLVFNTIEEAQIEADNCQSGVIVGDDSDYLPAIPY